MMRGAEDSAEEYQGGREIGDAQRSGSGSQSHGHQEDGDHGDAEKLKDALDPDVHYEPSPVIGHAQVRSAAEEQSESQKRRPPGLRSGHRS